MLRFISQGNHTCHASVCVILVEFVQILVLNEFTVCTNFISLKSDQCFS